MALALVFLSGTLFALGLGVSGMTQPEKISSFLNIAGNWDPSLILVMLGASATYLLGYSAMFQRSVPVLFLHLVRANRRLRPAPCRRLGTFWRWLGHDRLLSGACACRPSDRISAGDCFCPVDGSGDVWIQCPVRPLQYQSPQGRNAGRLHNHRLKP